MADPSLLCTNDTFMNRISHFHHSKLRARQSAPRLGSLLPGCTWAKHFPPKQQFLLSKMLSAHIGIKMNMYNLVPGEQRGLDYLPILAGHCRGAGEMGELVRQSKPQRGKDSRSQHQKQMAWHGWVSKEAQSRLGRLISFEGNKGVTARTCSQEGGREQGAGNREQGCGASTLTPNPFDVNHFPGEKSCLPSLSRFLSVI